MDQLTHSATGLFLSRAGLDRFTPYSGVILILAANAPDIDIATLAGGSLNYLRYHRHLTHSIFMLPFLALLPVLVVRLCARKPLRWQGAYLVSAAGVVSHLALDSTNIYGVRLLLPFSAHWFRLDLTSVIDVWIWLVILLALAAPAIGRLVSSEIGAQTRGTPGRRFAIAALLFLLLYNAGHGVLHSRALATLESRLYQGVAPLRVGAFPDPVNPWKFRGLVETRDFVSLQDLDLRTAANPEEGSIFYKPEPSPAIGAARHTAAFQGFLEFSQYPYWRVQPEPEGAFRVEAMDLRFGGPQNPGFVATAIVNSRMQVVRSWFAYGVTRPR